MGNAIELKKLRSVHKLYLMLMELDPESDVTEHCVRRLVYEGYVPTVETGNKRLACFEDLCAYLFQGKRWNQEAR